jgi:hypothetical protein
MQAANLLPVVITLAAAIGASAKDVQWQQALGILAMQTADVMSVVIDCISAIVACAKDEQGQRALDHKEDLFVLGIQPSARVQCAANSASAPAQKQCAANTASAPAHPIKVQCAANSASATVPVQCAANTASAPAHSNGVPVRRAGSGSGQAPGSDAEGWCCAGASTYKSAIGAREKCEQWQQALGVLPAMKRALALSFLEGLRGT